MDLGGYLNHQAVFHRAERHPYGFPRSVRLNPPAELGDGYEDGFVLDDSCLLTVKQVQLKGPFRAEEPGSGRLIFLFHLDGRREIELLGHARYALNTPRFVTYFQPRGMAKINEWVTGGTYSGVSVGFDITRPPRLWRDMADPSIQEFADLQFGRDFFWTEQPLLADMRQVAEQIINPAVHDMLIGEYLLLKSRELMFLAANEILRAKEQPDSAQARCKASAIRRYIDANGLQAISVLDIARTFSMSSSRLSHTFKSRFGKTIGDYILEIRMMKATELLTATDMPIKQIAYEVGYNHVSNFTIAFKRKYGQTPGQVRRTKSVGMVGLAAVSSPN
ncbi:MAG: helix-turn-helix transcriptional regulator [Roseitalea sp.]|jgi:AraC-like DNA-binding protein|nr:helix-turn-helix transcriptional regulator [Roseitalea sp.]MBO6721213.1 helix-turn-helix transcriptional regulator [Roseitalea sp.]MBO6744271.1 helix-turn-helix transcriptional regulator [Roseitalea sp.]